MSSNQTKSPKLMLSGCCVCSDERGWTENPLVYCDGDQCSVAVHLACYGIKSDELKDSVPWFCRKCQSQERHVKVRCELCPSKDGAFKKTNNNGWAHVICSLYIPEVRFGNVTTMEPIILSSIPQERFYKTCCICEDRGKESKAKIGACMQCNKPNCKQYFHVTCAQASGLLCEEAGNNDDNVKYCGYCKYHYQKLKKDHNVKFIPAFKPITRTEQNESSLDKKSHHHHNTDTSKPPKKKQKFYSTSSQPDSDNEFKHEKEKPKKKRTSSTSKDLSTSSSNKHNSSKESNSIFDNDSDSLSDNSIIGPPVKKLKEIKENNAHKNVHKNIYDSETDDDDEIQYNKKSSKNENSEKKKTKKTSTKNKETDKPIKENKKIKKKKEENINKKDKEDINKISKVNDKSNKSNQNETTLDKQISSKSTSKNKDSFSNKEKDSVDNDLIDKQIAMRNELPKQDFILPELIKHKSSLEDEKKSQQKTSKTLEELLEHNWIQTSQFLMEQSQFHDISSLISCLYQLKSENRTLDDKLKDLITKRDHLIAVNSRLSIPLTNAISSNNSENLDNQLAITNTNSTLTETTTNNIFFPNQQTFTSSIHTSTPSPNTNSQQKQQNHSNYFNHVNNSLNQNYNNKSLDLNSNLSNSYFESLNQASNQSSTSTSTSLNKQTPTNSNNLSYNGLFQAVNGQFNLNNSSNTSSPSKLNQFNNNLNNSNNLFPTQLFQNFLQNTQSFPNTILNGNQSKR